MSGLKNDETNLFKVDMRADFELFPAEVCTIPNSKLGFRLMPNLFTLNFKKLHYLARSAAAQQDFTEAAKWASGASATF